MSSLLSIFNSIQSADPELAAERCCADTECNALICTAGVSRISIDCMFPSTCWWSLFFLRMPKSGPWFYAVKHGRVPGVYNSWSECESQVKGFCKPTFKKFPTFEEAQMFVADKGNIQEAICVAAFGNEQSCSNGHCEKKDNLYQKIPTKSPVELNFSSSSGVKFEFQRIKNDFTATSPTSSLTSGSSHKSNPVTLTALSSEVVKVQCTLNALVGMTANLSADVGFIRSAVERIETAAYIAPGGKRNFNTMAGQPDSVREVKKSRKDGSDVGGYTGDNFVEEDGIHVYTDGGCLDNGRDGARAGIGVYWGRNDLNNVSEALTGRPSNNRAEIHAAVRAIQIAKRKGIRNLIIHTDSQFLINGITKWIKRWKKNGWKLSTGHPVINKEDFTALDSELTGISVKWVYVKGHSGNPANEEADRLAKQGAEKAVLNVKYELL